MVTTLSLTRPLGLMLVVGVLVLVVVGGASPAAAAPPAAPTVTSAPTTPSRLATPSWSFSGPPGATLECRLRRGSIVASDWVSCTSPQGFDLSAQPDGTYVFEVRAVLGVETGAVASSTYVFDTTPPDAPVLTGPGAIGSDPSPTWSFTTDSSSVVAYDSTTYPLPPSMPSIAYAARSTAEVGDLVAFSGSKRHLESVTVTLESWAAHSDFPAYPTGPWQHPITLNLYSVDRSGVSPSPGPLIATDVRTVDIPWRPEPDPSCPVSGPYVGYRAADGQCHFSVPANATFDLTSLGVDLPDEVIVGVAFDTQSSGASPTGLSGPYNLLNLAVRASAPSAGTNVEPDAIFYNSTFAGFYADAGAGGTGTFRRDTGWGSYTPAVQVVTTDPPGPPASTECLLTGGTTVIAGWAPCAAPVGYDLRAAPDGTYTIAVRATDAAGNTGPVGTVDYTLDRSVPATSPPPDVTMPGGPPAGGSGNPARSVAVDLPVLAPIPLPATPAASGSGSAQTGRSPRAFQVSPSVSHSAGDDGSLFSRLLTAILRAVTRHRDDAVFPMSVLFLVGGFLMVQNRIDRSDPKLALAPVYADPDLWFPPPPGGQR